MADEFENQEKTEEPSTHRIEKFRKQGDVASSRELTSILILSACALTLGISLTYVYEILQEFAQWIYALDFSNAYTSKSQKTIITKTVISTLKCIGPVFITIVCAAVIANITQIGFLFSPDVLKWNPDRINPFKGLKRLFSMRSVVEAIKGVFKFAFIIFIVYVFMKQEMSSFNGFFHLDFFHSSLYGKTILIKLTFFILMGLSIIALGDLAYQKFTYKKKLMQSKEQAKREIKEQEGNPEIKQRIKRIQKEMAQKRMISNVPKADVIVTNPTHISVALQYDKKEMVSPKVIAKGADFLAMRIRKVAKTHDVPMVENVKLARTLYKTVKVGEGIPRMLYQAVAEVLAFVYKLKRRK